VEVPALGELAGAKVTVQANQSEAHVVEFRGTEPLAFAFKCFEVGYLEGILAFTSFKPGAVALSDALDLQGHPIDPGVSLAAVDDVQLIEFGSVNGQ